jgi:hypothetical protein
MTLSSQHNYLIFLLRMPLFFNSSAGLAIDDGAVPVRHVGTKASLGHVGPVDCPLMSPPNIDNVLVRSPTGTHVDSPPVHAVGRNVLIAVVPVEMASIAETNGIVCFLLLFCVIGVDLVMKGDHVGVLGVDVIADGLDVRGGEHAADVARVFGVVVLLVRVGLVIIDQQLSLYGVGCRVDLGDVRRVGTAVGGVDGDADVGVVLVAAVPDRVHLAHVPPDVLDVERAERGAGLASVPVKNDIMNSLKAFAD